MNELKCFYNKLNSKHYRSEATFVFVYNNMDTYGDTDNPYYEECFTDQEAKEIVDSISDLFSKTLRFKSEYDFIKWCVNDKSRSDKTYLYTMAQNMQGANKRSLIPSISQYLNIININADTEMSVIGCDKKLMFKSLISLSDKYIAPSIFIEKDTNPNYAEIVSCLGNSIVIKPTTESCCIDVNVLLDTKTNEVRDTCEVLFQKYPTLMIQQFIGGKEVGITVVHCNDKFYTLEPIHLKPGSNDKYLTNQDSFSDNFELSKIDVSGEVLEVCKSYSKELGFKCTTRYDFKFFNGNYYLFDISPNPTINGSNCSSNMAARETLSSDERGIFRLMVLNKFRLFEPSFDSTI